MALYDYPHTGNYDQDLGFLIDKYFKLGKDYNTLVKIYEKIKEYIASIDKKMLEYTKNFTIEHLQKWLDDGTINNIILTLGKIVTFVDTTNELKTKENLVKDQLILTSGFYNKNDKAGGLFIVSDSPNGFNIKNNDLFINLIDSPNEINLEKTGVKENEDISNILNDIVNYYTKIIIPKGTFLINSTININSDTILVGNESVLQTTNSIGYLIKSNSNTFCCENINFLGNAIIECNDENGLVCIECLNSSKINIENCNFSKFNKNIEITNSNNVLINKCYIEKSYETLNKINGYGVLFEGVNNGQIINCNMTDIERHCIYINECNNIQVNNNNLTGQKTNYLRFSNYEGNIKINGSKNIIIDSNTLDGNYYSISLLKSFDSDFGCSDIIITNNICKNIIKGYSFIRGFIGIIENGNYSNIKINNNIIYNDNKNSNTRGIVLDYGTLNNIEICNNNIRNVGYGIRINRTTPIFVNNNNVINSDLGYDFSTNDLHLYGGYNYYNNCNQSCNGSLIHLRYCTFKGFINSSNPISKVISVINSNENLIFVGNSTEVEITNITGGATNQEVTINSDYVGGAKLIKANLPSYIKINSDFTAKGTIILKKINTTWYEVSRITI